METNQFREILAYGREQSGVEFKGPGSIKDSHLLVKVVRVCLSMANRRGGGHVIIGIEDPSDGKLIPTGLTVEQIKSWKHDDLADIIANYADPSIIFETTPFEYDEKEFIIIRVHEFPDIPILCKKAFPEVLRRGACYVRTRRKPETTEIPTQEEMRDLLDLAIEKGVRKFISQARAAGIQSSTQQLPEDKDLYLPEISDLVTGEE